MFQIFFIVFTLICLKGWEKEISHFLIIMINIFLEIIKLLKSQIQKN